MSLSRHEPRYLLAPPGSLTPELRSRLEALGPFSEVDSPDALGNGDAAEPGWILVPARAGAGPVTALLERLGGMPGVWSPLLVVEQGEEVSVLPISPGFRSDLDEVRGRLEREDAADAVLSFRKALPVLSRVRHDINNALTAAFAEVQLLLLDIAPGSEEERSLRSVETQLRRVRDLVAELSPIRPPGR